MPWPQQHPEDAAIDRARDELAAIRASRSDELNAAHRKLAQATVRLHACEMNLHICRRLRSDDTGALYALAEAQAAVSHASDELVGVLDAASGRAAA